MELVSLYKYTTKEAIAYSHIHVSSSYFHCPIVTFYTADEFEIRLILEFNYVY